MRKNAKAVGAVERLGWAVQCSDMPEWKIAGWVKNEAQTKGLNLSEEAIQILVQKAGVELSYLLGALEQLSLFLYPQKSVTAEDVRNLPVPGLESDVFPFVDAVALRQIDKALRMMGQLEDGVDTGTLMLLYGRFRELLMIAVGRAKGWGQTQVGEKLGVNPYRLKILWDQSSQFTVIELKEALKDLIHIQAGVVTGRLAKGVAEVLLELWVLKQGRRKAAVRG
jgi:DNA polymerase-3 subunit delta